jgi:hypothetical protein
MSRVLPITVRRALFDAETPDTALMLLTAAHVDLPTPIRVSSAPVKVLSMEPYLLGVTSRANDFTYVWMGEVVPGEEEDVSPNLQIVFEDVESQVGALLRSFQTPPALVTIEWVMASAPNIVLWSWVDLETKSAQGGSTHCTLDISRDQFSDQPSPAGRFGKWDFPGLHR